MSQTPLHAAQVREAFLSFFGKHGHARVPSSSLIPANDPTLLFTNAGMVQFKDVFTGREKRDYVRAATTQKCVRAGGKHNDLENVGFTARHHTFFEMLGNFSFGDYFKADAIRWGWEFVTQVLRLPKERLAVTVFKGEDGIPADEEAFELWAKTGVAPDRIRKLGKADNFWAMGDTGPCGPCSEIYFYLPGGAVKDGDLPGDSENWLEIWNLVFMQFERKVKDGPLVSLPKPSIDTGAGLERVTSVVQGKRSNYDTDLFTPLLTKAAALSNKKYGANDAESASMRVIADHARTAAFLIADGVQPSNEGRGYVLRRIMRRAIRHGAQRLGMDELFFHHVVAEVVATMGEVYPELHERKTLVLDASRHEEETFRRTLRNGERELMTAIGKLKASGGKAISAETVHFLYDTHGYPPDLTRVIALEHELEADVEGAEKLKGGKGAQESKLNDATAVSDVWLRLGGSLPATSFTGYDGTSGSGSVLALVKDGAQVEVAKAGDTVEIVFDASPFYAESGGQVGDAGTLGRDGVRATVLDTKKPVPTLHVHTVKVEQGSIAVHETLQQQVDGARRAKIRANHSATHLLHRALRLVVGEAVTQKGSVVDADYLRFDFSCFSALSPAQLEQVEDLVNGWIRQNAQAQTKLMGLDEARKAGAMALFGEKYGERVRVVTVHPESTELCGGTHVERTGDIGLLKIVQELAVASGVRRVLALTGQAAIAHGREQERHLDAAAALYKSPPAELSKRIEASQKRIKELEKRLEEVQLKASSGAAKGEAVAEVNGIKVLTQRVDPADANVLRQLADRYRDQLRSGVVGLGGETADGKALILVAVTKDLVDRGFKAGDAVRVMAQEVGGKGGGKPELAQAGGTDATKIPQAFDKLLALVKEHKPT